MNAKQEKQDGIAALKLLSMRKLRAHEQFWSSPEARDVRVDGKPVLLWVMEQATQARADHEAQLRLRALSIVNWLLDRGLDPNQMHESNSLLMDAAILGDVAAARRLIRGGAVVDLTSPLGNTALHWAAMAGRPAMCKLLLSEGASLEVSNHSRQTPLHCAADRMRMNTITVLHEANASWDKKDVHDRTPLDVLRHRDAGLAKLWTNKPERDRLAKATEVSVASPSIKRSRRL